MIACPQCRVIVVHPAFRQTIDKKEWKTTVRCPKCKTTYLVRMEALSDGASKA
jgi:transcription elongation factor Elf1